MRRIIFLKVEYGSGPKGREAAFKQFRKDAEPFSFIKILKELDKSPEVLIEFPNDKYEEMYDGLRALDIVEVIDSIIPENL